jgi:hypothetical protein
LPKSTNFSNSFSNRLKLDCAPEIARPYTNFGPQKSADWLKLAHRPAKADPYRGQRHPWLASPSTASSTGRLCLPPHRCSKPSPRRSRVHAPPLLSRTCSRRSPQLTHRIDPLLAQLRLAATLSPPRPPCSASASTPARQASVRPTHQPAQASACCSCTHHCQPPARPSSASPLAARRLPPTRPPTAPAHPRACHLPKPEIAG